MSAVRADRYFAYGSNMLAERMQQRLGSIQAAGTARLDGYAWCCNKLGRDGTAKANLVRQAGACVYGVLYRLHPDGWRQLDQFEPGYQRIAVEVFSGGRKEEAFTYISKLLTSRPASKAYLGCIIRGAEAHALPATHIKQIAAVPVDS